MSLQLACLFYSFYIRTTFFEIFKVLRAWSVILYLLYILILLVFTCHLQNFILAKFPWLSIRKKATNLQLQNYEILLPRNSTLAKFYPIKVVYGTLIFLLLWLVMKFLSLLFVINYFVWLNSIFSLPFEDCCLI